MRLPGPEVLGPPADRGEGPGVLRRAVEVRVDHIDTGHFYGPDVSNELIHGPLHSYPEELVLVSNLSAAHGAQGEGLAAQRPGELRAGVEATVVLEEAALSAPDQTAFS
jgi:aryl-alcohol dehydrogenase-like predicted oxidoreductase